MKKIFLLFKREFRKYFDTPLAYIIIIVFFVISGWLFTSTIFLINRITIANFVVNVPLLLMFFAPAIAMQLLAGEFHSGTMEILGTLPLKDREIVGGKFLAAFVLLSLAIVFTLIFPISISFLGNLDWGQVSGAYIGMILIGGTFLAGGLFASSISSNQVVAFIIGFAIAFTLFIVGKVTQILPSYLRPIVDFIGIDSHWENLSRGVIDFRDIIYFLSLWVFFFYTSLIAFGKRVRIGLYALSSAGLLAGILIIINILAGSFVVRWDLTENNIYSLSNPSKKIARELKDPVIIKAYFSESLPPQYQTMKKYLKDLLYEYRAYSDGTVKFKFLNPSQDESVAREAMVNRIPPLKFTEAGKEKFEIKQGYMGLVFLHKDKKEVIPVVEDTGGLEYDITTRIKKITSSELRTVGYVGDFGMADQVKTNISNRYNFKNIKTTATLKEKNYYSIVVKWTEDFSEKKKKILNSAVEMDIPVALFADTFKVDMENFSASEIETEINDFLDKFGIKIRKALILDSKNQRINVTTQRGYFTIQNVVNYPYFPLITRLNEENPIVKDLGSVTFPFVSPVEIDEKVNEDYNIEILARTSDKSWLEENPSYVAPLREYSPDEEDEKGPFIVACSLNKKDSPFRMVIVSNSRFTNQQFYDSDSNRSFFLNSIDWITQDYNLISIRSKRVVSRPMKEISSTKKTAIKYIDILLIPLLLLGTGIYRWKSRPMRDLKLKQRILNE
ncbi:MAG: Gldg family protein [Elusimicrobiota bacterium]